MNCTKALLAAALVSTAAVAAGNEETDGEEPPVLEEIVIVGHPLSADGLATPVDVVAGEEYDRKVADSIGETVGGEPGIHNSSFGVAVGRPVIHGLGGARVRVLEDRIDTLDVSVTSGDHAVTVDPFIADRVEIYKGSGTLLYGSGAIGGVVDTHTGRIPHETPEKLSGKLDLRRADNAGATNGSFRLDGGQGNFSWHLDGFARDADDYEIPGYAESALVRAMEEDHHEEEGEEPDHEGEDEDGDHEEEEEEEAFGILPASRLDVQGGSAGASFIGERGFFGVAVSTLDAEYGIPGHGHGHDHEEEHEEEEGDHEEEEGDHEEEEGSPFIDLKQTRIDIEGAFADPMPGFSNFNFRMGINDYEHQEVEPSGEVGAAFDNQAWEARAELTHELFAGWEGAFGLQLSDRSFSVVGEEAFTPPVDTRAVGAFWVGQRSFGGFELEAGVRLDSVEHDPSEGDDRDFTGISASLGAIFPLDATWTASVLGDYSTRAPVGEELFSDGPHLATQSFEIGDAGLGEEKAFNISATLRGDGDGWSLSGTAYYTVFGDFIYQAATGLEMDDLPVREFRQADATFAGLDLEAAIAVAEWQNASLDVTAFFDTVSAQLDIEGNDNVARIPPGRAGVGLALTAGRFSADLDYVRVLKQDDVAEFELETDAYNDLRAYLAWEIERSGVLTRIFLRAKNLTGDEQRLHASPVKDFAPSPDRMVEAGLRIRF